MIPGPLFLIAFPLVFAPLVWLLRRWATLAGLLSVAVSMLMAWMVWRLPLDEPLRLWGRPVALGETVSLLGRELALSQTDRWDMALMFLVAAGLFLFASRVSQGWTFFPLGLTLLSVLSGALLVESHVFAILLLQIAAALCVFLIQGGQTGSTRGALRFLTFITLAIPPLLVTSWLIGRYELTPDDVGLLDASTLLFAFGFAILLGVVPFHTWVPAVGNDAPPLVTTFVLGLFYAVVWFIVLELLQSYEWLAGHPDLAAALNYSGYAMVIVGAGLAAVQRRLGPLMGYAALADMGAAHLALGLRSSAGVEAALFALGTRAVSLTVMAMGISVIRFRAESDRFDRLMGWGHRVPWSTAALVIGGLSLAGLPPAAGFTARWSIAQLVARDQATPAALLLVASVAVGIGVVRALMALLREPAPEYVGSELIEELTTVSSDANESEAPPEREPRIAVAMIIVSLAICLALALFPNVHTAIIQQVAENYTFFNALSP